MSSLRVAVGLGQTTKEDASDKRGDTNSTLNRLFIARLCGREKLRTNAYLYYSKYALQLLASITIEISKILKIPNDTTSIA
jgi:hypothetical protein